MCFLERILKISFFVGWIVTIVLKECEGRFENMSFVPVCVCVYVSLCVSISLNWCFSVSFNSFHEACVELDSFFQDDFEILFFVNESFVKIIFVGHMWISLRKFLLSFSVCVFA